MVVVPRQHAAVAVVHLPALGGTPGNDLDYSGDVQACPGCELHAFRQPLEHAGDAYLVRHFGQLSVTRRAEMADALGVVFDHRARGGEVRRRATHHDGQPAVFGARLAAGNRRVEKAQAALCGEPVQFAGQGRRGRGVVDQYRFGRHGGQYAGIAQHHRAQVVVVADAGEHQFRVPGRLGGAGGTAPAVALDPLPGAARGAVVDGDLAAAGLQVAGHGKAHHP